MSHSRSEADRCPAPIGPTFGVFVGSSSPADPICPALPVSPNLRTSETTFVSTSTVPRCRIMTLHGSADCATPCTANRSERSSTPNSSSAAARRIETRPSPTASPRSSMYGLENRAGGAFPPFRGFASGGVCETYDHAPGASIERGVGQGGDLAVLAGESPLAPEPSSPCPDRIAVLHPPGGRAAQVSVLGSAERGAMK